jgi:hypothetical protein
MQFGRILREMQVGKWIWYSMSLRKYSAIWSISNTYLLKGYGEDGSLSFRLLFTGGIEGSWVWQPGSNLLPVNWKFDSV